MFEFNIWPRKRTNNLLLKYYLFGTIKLVTNAINSNFRKKAFDVQGSWSFCNDFAGNVVVFGVDNSSSSLTDDGRDNAFIFKRRTN